MNKFPVLSMYRVIYVLIGWAIVLGGLYIAYETGTYRDFNGREQVNAATFLGIAGVAAFFGATMIIVGETINLLLRIEDHLDTIRKSHQTPFQLPVNQSPRTSSTKHPLDLNPIPDDD